MSANDVFWIAFVDMVPFDIAVDCLLGHLERSNLEGLRSIRISPPIDQPTLLESNTTAKTRMLVIMRLSVVFTGNGFCSEQPFKHSSTR